jgi:hypothetical protein
MPKPTLNVIRSTRDVAAAPAHLGDAGRELWASIQAAYQITDPGGRVLLCTAAEAADRIASVRSQIDEQGELLAIRGIPRVNPLCAVERDARAALIRALKELHLDLEPLRDRPGRPEGPRWSGVKEQW